MKDTNIIQWQVIVKKFGLAYYDTIDKFKRDILCVCVCVLVSVSVSVSVLVCLGIHLGSTKGPLGIHL